MIKYHIKSNKAVSLVRDEPIYITENKISSFKISLDATFCNYPVEKLQFEMRCYLPPEQGSESDYISYILNIENRVAEVPITNDITEKPQTVKIIFFATKDGNVIGKTNVIEKKIEDAPLKGDPLTPRAQFDEVIAEQRQTIQTQGETITSQGETITSQGEQITELNGEVTELNTENTRLENQHETDLRYIDYLINNPPEAHLQPKSVTPTNQMQVVEPDEGYQGLSTVTVGATTPPRLQSKQVAPSMSTSYITADNGYDGLSSVTVDNVDASIDPNIQPENIKENVVIVGVRGTYNPVYGTAAGGIYISEKNNNGYARILTIKDWVSKNGDLTIPLSSEGRKYVEEIRFVGINDFAAVGQRAFDGYNSLQTIAIPNCINRLKAYSFISCSLLSDLFIPNSITTIEVGAFYLCNGLQNVVIEQGFNANGLDLSASTLYSAETIVSCLEALADRTGEKAYTITFGATNLNKLAPEQKAIAINKNWNLT